MKRNGRAIKEFEEQKGHLKKGKSNWIGAGSANAAVRRDLYNFKRFL